MNDSAHSSPLGEGLVYEARLPLRWKALAPSAQAASGAPDGHLDEANAEWLRVLSATQEHGPEHGGEENPELMHEIRRLEFKLDLVLAMVGQMLARQLELPPPVPVRLSAERLEWLAADGPVPGEEIEVELYLLPEYPRPLYLRGVVESSEEKTGWIRLRFAGLSEPVRDWLERTIFRYHRRQIALSRRSTPQSR
jgi:hypothetical protein